MDDDDELDDQPDAWATRTIAAIDLARTVSTMLLIGAAVALAFGLIAAIITYASSDFFSGGVSDDGLTAMVSGQDRMLLATSMQTFVSALLPAGLLAAAAAALRLQAARTEALPSQD